MSINTGTPDDYAAPGNQCPACWPADETPKHIYIAISGVLQGALWIPADPPPPNGLFKLAIQIPCRWLNIFPDFDIFYKASLAPSTLTIEGPLHVAYFFGTNINPCIRWFANEIQVPAGNLYYAGHATIWDFTQSDESTIQENLALLNIAPAERTFINIRNGPANTAVKVISARIGRTNIAIKEEIT